MPDVIDDRATRITIQRPPLAPLLYTDPATAQADLDRYEDLRGQDVEVVAGPTLLHLWSFSGASVWSDGLLSSGEVRTPMSVPAGEPDRQWRKGFCRFEAAESPLDMIRRARNGRDIGPDVWMPWLDAVAAAEETTHTERTERATAPDATARRTLTLIRHRVSCADGVARDLWQILELVEASSIRTPSGWEEVTRQSIVYPDESAARAALTGLADGLPPMVTVAELAPILGGSTDAVRQAVSRATRNRFEHRGRPLLPRPTVFRGSRAHWYDPRAVKRWWDGRPGHGPGRGHTSQ
ncbi:hypothetical protein ACFYY1_35390 [Streptomyces sp. NPDC001890]|uniref:hypothetical protein n=1 Tax=Streptomyces sp. NPDC001890 TaxID=3364620 RepID=UPI0036CD08E2